RCMNERPSSREGGSPAPSTASLGPRLFTSRDTVDRIERAALAALPARDRWELPGWVCLADDGGFVGRANAATPVAHAEPAALHEVVMSYSARALSPRVRWTPQASVDTATELSTDKWRTWGEVLVMTRPVDELPAPSPLGTAVNGSAVATAEWGRAYATQYRPGEDAVRLRLAAEAPRPKRYVLAER